MPKLWITAKRMPILLDMDSTILKIMVLILV